MRETREEAEEKTQMIFGVLLFKAEITKEYALFLFSPFFSDTDAVFVDLRQILFDSLDQ